ncbi:hypothetical protein P9232_03395 [Weizmannia sp. CD-2023]|uniref:hypothetical protein n=1 Tax=Heyndrickxia TaxID=2837504 RepID=UPI000AFC89E9|nr:MULTISPECIES: hypothetical protein [Heyndrickxia]MED4320495.1 hypothetical protein [Weizmannia sp. CD-2023]
MVAYPKLCMLELVISFLKVIWIDKRRMQNRSGEHQNRAKQNEPTFRACFFEWIHHKPPHSRFLSIIFPSAAALQTHPRMLKTGVEFSSP